VFLFRDLGLICSDSGKSRKRQASVNGDVISNAFCSRTANTSDMFLMKVSVQSILPRDEAMLCAVLGVVILSVCLSVRLSSVTRAGP